MSRHYQLTETAAVDIDEIVTYIADEGGVDAALRVHAALVEAFELLAERPASGTGARTSRIARSNSGPFSPT